MVEFIRKKSCLKKESGVLRQDRKEVQGGTVLLVIDENNDLVNYLLSNYISLLPFLIQHTYRSPLCND